MLGCSLGVREVTPSREPSIRRGEMARVQPGRRVTRTQLIEGVEATTSLNLRLNPGMVRGTHIPNCFEYCVWGLTEEEVIKVAAYVKSLHLPSKEPMRGG